MANPDRSLALTAFTTKEIIVKCNWVSGMKNEYFDFMSKTAYLNL